MKNIQSIGVIGAGQMGQGITQMAAMSHLSVTCFDTSLEVLEKAKLKINNQLKRMIDKQKITEDQKNQITNRITWSTLSSNTKQIEQCQIIIEAIIEDVNIKTQLFSQLDKVTPSDVILFSNTSSISITRLAATTKRPHKVAGLHFMNPVPVMRLVEGIKGLQTSDDTFLQAKNLAEKMQKVFVASLKDTPGFIVNRILMPMINEAFFALDEGIASAKDIDTAMKLGTNHPMGPLELADFIGLDVCLAIMKVLHEDIGDSKYRPSPLLAKYVEAGYLGRKTSKGVFNHSS